ncbi:hypothetical protein LXA43DRAFT_669931 [Ganoderma leucocontextum]|nr:hypothetical protein LXA43DRAFT_669931 [Ganoderma leucocontextum]
MYGGTAAYWALMVRSYSLHVSSTTTIVTTGNMTRPALEYPRSLRVLRDEPHPWVMSINSDAVMRPQVLEMCTGTAALLVNITLGDGIVWWRAWVVCARKAWIFSLAAILILSTAAIGITETAEACSTIHHLQLTLGWTAYVYAVDGALFIGNYFGFVSSMVTLLTNVVATGLIGYQAWVHSRMVRECHLNLLPSRVGVRALLALLIESGILYCIVWAFVVAYEATLTIAFFDTQTTTGIGKHVAYIKSGIYLVEGALVPLIAIYPTVIIILVTLGNSCFEAATAHDPCASLPLFIPSESTALPLVAQIDGAIAALPIDLSAPTLTPTGTSFSVDN